MERHSKLCSGSFTARAGPGSVLGWSHPQSTLQLQATATGREPHHHGRSVSAAKIGLWNETFSFPFSAAPERFATHTLRLRAATVIARPRGNQARSRTRARLASERAQARRKTFSELFSARPDRFAVHGRPPLSARARCPVAPLTLFLPLRLPSNQTPVASARGPVRDFLPGVPCGCWRARLSTFSVAVAPLPPALSLFEKHTQS